MVLVIYFLLLLAASVEDSRTHTVQPYKIWLVWLVGMVHIVLEKENRWVTLALTCICFVFLLIVYRLVIYAAKYRKQSLCFGGADVKLIPGMLLVQGWDVVFEKKRVRDPFGAVDECRMPSGGINLFIFGKKCVIMKKE